MVNAGKSAVCTSDVVTPIGYDTAAPVIPSAGVEYSISGGAWTSLITYINPGQTIQIRASASSAWATTINYSVDIGGEVAAWSISTAAASAPGTWDTGWTSGSWNFTTPQYFNWVRVQLWAPGGGGGGSGGCRGETWGDTGGNGTAGGNSQFGTGLSATGGGKGFGGTGGNGAGGNGSDGGSDAAGIGVGGDTNTTGGGANGGAGGARVTWYGGTSGKGGDGTKGGFSSKTYQWGALLPSTVFGVLVGQPGAAGGGGASGGFRNGLAGAIGGYGRCFIDWG